MEIAGIKFKNRFIMAPVKTGYGDTEGNFSSRHLAFWNVRSKHVSAVIPEPFYIDKNVRELPTQIGLDSDDKIEGHIKFVEMFHKNNAKAIAHINHPGRMANPKLPGNIYVSASSVTCHATGITPSALTIPEIKKVQMMYVDAAVRAEKAGYDLLELQFGLGYLIAQFLSPQTNTRIDEYGGSFNNRMRFGLEILREIKKASSLPVIVRLSGDEIAPDGMHLNDAIEIAKVLEKEKAAAIHVTAGNACLTPPWYYQHHFIPKGKNWEFAKAIKEKISLPVITVGQINEFEDIEKIINTDTADFIALGRALIADPDFVGKYLNEVEGPVRPCSSCLTGCLGRIKIGKGLQCEINPEVGKELEPLLPADKIKNYAVVGGGLAGLQAALTLKDRGHSVTIFEKDKLGGQFNFAPLPAQKNSLQKQIDYFTEKVKDIPFINKEAHADELISNFDAAVLATGSKPVIPAIPGLVEYKWAEILYDTNIPESKTVLIIGGGMIGVEVANTLVDYKNHVIIIEMLDDIARDMEMITRKLNLTKLKKTGVKIFTNTKVKKIEDRKAFLEKGGIRPEEIVLENIDVFVVAAGMKPRNNLADDLEGKLPYYKVGDAGKIGDAVSAIQSAYFTCKEI